MLGRATTSDLGEEVAHHHSVVQGISRPAWLTDFKNELKNELKNEFFNPLMASNARIENRLIREANRVMLEHGKTALLPRVEHSGGPVAIGRVPTKQQMASKVKEGPPQPGDAPIPLSSAGTAPVGASLVSSRVDPDDDDDLLGPLRRFGDGGHIDPSNLDPTTLGILQARLADRREARKAYASDLVLAQQQANQQCKKNEEITIRKLDRSYSDELQEIDYTYHSLLSSAYVPDENRNNNDELRREPVDCDQSTKQLNSTDVDQYIYFARISSFCIVICYKRS